MNSVLISLEKKFGIGKNEIRNTVLKAFKKRGLENLEVSVFVTGPESIRELNKRYRKLDRSTSVLTFFQGQVYPPKRRQRRIISGGKTILGDIVICPEIAKKQGLKVAFLLEHGLKNLLSEIQAAENLRAGFS